MARTANIANGIERREERFVIADDFSRIGARARRTRKPANRPEKPPLVPYEGGS
jgi:hypothetical protein